MASSSETILAHLRKVAAHRSARQADPSLASQAAAIKRFQHARFEKTYADLLAHPRYARAARFFLDDLYGPYDFSDRDAQFARVVPAMVRLFPGEIVATVADLAELHALSEELDDQMTQSLDGDDVDGSAYLRAWQHTGRHADRLRQIALMRGIGGALDRYTRRKLLRRSLALMKRPARAAGLAALQTFLETGFDTFAEMRGADEFLNTVAARETALVDRLFAATPGVSEAAACAELP